MKKHEEKLEKKLNSMNVWAIAFGCIVGWGSFINPGKKFLPTSGVAGTAISMILGAIIMIIIAYSYAYMVPKYPKAGGEFTFTKKCFGNKFAFICGWFLVIAYLANVPMNSTAISLIIDGLFGSILKFGFHYTIAGFEVYFGEIFVAVFILILFALLNIRGIKVVGIIQTILVSCLISSVLILTFTALISSKVNFNNMKPIWGFDKLQAIDDAKIDSYLDISKYEHSEIKEIVGGILATLAIAPWAFVGFDTIPQAAEEFNFSYKKVSFIMIIAILFGGFVYISNNTVTAATLNNWPDLIVNSDNTPWLLLTASEKLLGNFGKLLVGVAVLSAVLTGIMGFYMATSRLMYSMSKDGYLPRFFGQIDSKFKTPKNAIIFCMFISLSGPFLGREALGWFVDMSSIGASIGYGFTCFATFVTLKKSKEHNKFLSVISVLGTLFSIMFIVLQIIPIPGFESVHFVKQSYIMLLIWIFLGLIFYIKQKNNFVN